MGLSNEERIHNSFHIIKDIFFTANEITEEYCCYIPYKELKENCFKLWHDLLGKTQNQSHWILGSSAGNKVTYSTKSPWGIAVMEGIKEANKEGEEDPFQENTYDHKTFLSVEYLLNNVNNNLARVFNIYARTEDLQYNIRRYDDEFLKEYSAVSERISLIQGLCFEIFSQFKPECTKAYLLNKIVSLLLQNPYMESQETKKQKMDVVCVIFNEFEMQHLVSEPMQPLSVVSTKELCKIYTKLREMEHKNQLSTPVGLEERLFALIRLSNRRFHYEHQHKKMMEILSKNKVKYNTKKLEDLLSDCKKLHAEKEKEDSRRYSARNFDDEMLLFTL